LVTVHQKDVNFIEDTINTIKSEPELLNRGVGFLLYNLLDGLIANYFPYLIRLIIS